MHTPFVHRCPIGHAIHAAPFAPQPMFVCIDGVTQKFAGPQQPLHVPGPHAAVTHCPFTHCSPMPHRLHTPPVFPHASGESPTTQEIGRAHV